MSENNDSDLCSWEEIVHTPTASRPESVVGDVSDPHTPLEMPANESQVSEESKESEKCENDRSGSKTDELEDTDTNDTTIPRAKKPLPQAKLEPTVRECDWEEFKNYYSPQDTTHAIDILLAGDGLDEEMEDEQLKRLSTKKRKKFLKSHERKPLRRSEDAKEYDECLIKRVRINSPAVLSLLSKVMGQDFCVKTPHTFLRPFRPLIHYHDKMEERFASLEARVGQKTSSSNDGIRAYDQVKVYIEFVKHRLFPIYHKFDNLDYTHQPKVRYSDLWCLFRSGEVIHAGEGHNVGNSVSTSQRPSGQQLWRLYWMQRITMDWSVDDLKDKKGKLRRDDLSEPEEISTPCYYIDFDGKSYKGVWRSFTIQQFEGEVDITSLPIYPIRFQPGYENTIQSCRERGERFRDLLSQQHSKRLCPARREAEDEDGDDGESEDDDSDESDVDEEDLKGREVSEYIDSDVVIDFEEAYKAHPSWQPQYANWPKGTMDTKTKEDKFAIIQWSDPTRTKIIQKTNEIVLTADQVGSLEWKSLTDKDDFPIHPDVRVTEKDPSMQKFSPDDVSLLPARLMGYSLRHGRFVNIDIGNIKDLSADSDHLSKLLIPATDKTFVNAMMQDFYDQQDRQIKSQSTGTVASRQSPVGALKFLFHGPFGVGKTTTAEGLAAAHHKGLLTISCDDLGIDVEAMEDKLLDTIRLVQKWNCVLHIVGLENFLSRRDKGDSLSKNELVSALFRPMRKYHGISFIEVNDAALVGTFASKVDAIVTFNHLDLDQTLAVFQSNIKHSERIARQGAAETDQPVLVIKEEAILSFARLYPGWNGHQISKALQMAASLAYVEQKGATERHLAPEHFERVEKFIP
ncbi:hypothetical protein ACHAPA_004130 [Fusarium lateritium]